MENKIPKLHYELALAETYLNLTNDFISAAVEDAKDKGTFSCDALNDFEAETNTQIKDLKYADGVLSFLVNEKWYNLTIQITFHQDSSDG